MKKSAKKKAASRGGKASKAKAKAKSSSRIASRSPRKKAMDVAKVRQSITNIVGKEADKITEAVVAVAEAGQLASAKFLFEAAGIYPKSEETAAEPEDESLARILLGQITPGPKPAGEDAGEEEAEDEDSASGGSSDAGENKGV